MFNVATAIGDLNLVRKKLGPVAARWKHLGMALGLDEHELDAIEKDIKECAESLTKVLSSWLKKNYMIDKFGEPSWELLAKAVADPSGGHNKALAEEITRYAGESSTCIS